MDTLETNSHPQKNTLLQFAQANAETKYCKRVFFPTQEEFYFFSPTLRCFNFFANAQPTTDKQLESILQTSTGQSNLTWTTEARTGNKVLPQCGLTEVIEQLCYYQLLCTYSAYGFQIPHCGNTRTVGGKAKAGSKI